MKETLRKLCKPILAPFESGEGPYTYTRLNRSVLIALGGLFGILAIAVIAVGSRGQGWGFLLPGVVFGGVALVCLIIGFLGNDRAVSRIWGRR
ncbi:MAG: hypothetical protein CMK32_13945 [Porticoccaceae bacterium]|nr:hypothetical protein [Porticoccaceae bacterium]